MSRFTLLLLVVVAVALKKVHAETDEEKEIHETMVPIIAECSKEHGANVEEVMASKKNHDYEAVDGCLIECVFKKMGVMDDEGAFVVEKMIEHAKKYLKKDGDTDKIEEAMQHCTSESEKNSEDKCVKSKMMLACMMEHKEAKFGDLIKYVRNNYYGEEIKDWIKNWTKKLDKSNTTLTLTHDVCICNDVQTRPAPRNNATMKMLSTIPLYKPI